MCFQAKEVVKGPWNTGGSVASEDMPRKPLTTSVAANPWVGVHERVFSCAPASRRERGLGQRPKVFLNIAEGFIYSCVTADFSAVTQEYLMHNPVPARIIRRSSVICPR